MTKDLETKENWEYDSCKFEVYMPILIKRIEKAIHNIDIIFDVHEKFEILLTNIFYKFEHRSNFTQQDNLLENAVKEAN